MTQRELRAYLSFSLRLARAEYDAQWSRARNEPSDGDGPDLIDVFYDRVGGLMPHDYEWMTYASVIREAVTGYEVFVAKAVDEVLVAHGLERKRSHRTPGWAELNECLGWLGLNASPPDVRHIIDLRDVLTHKRGELRTDRDRRRFSDQTDRLSAMAHLDKTTVNEVLDSLGAAADEIDPVLWAYSDGGYRAKVCP